jgi:hypothetical protein
MIKMNFWWYMLQMMLVTLIFIMVIFLIKIIGVILDKFFPKNKISKSIDNVLDWIMDNLGNLP